MICADLEADRRTRRRERHRGDLRTRRPLVQRSQVLRGHRAVRAPARAVVLDGRLAVRMADGSSEEFAAGVRAVSPPSRTFDDLAHMAFVYGQSRVRSRRQLSRRGRVRGQCPPGRNDAAVADRHRRRVRAAGSARRLCDVAGRAADTPARRVSRYIRVGEDGHPGLHRNAGERGGPDRRSKRPRPRLLSVDSAARRAAEDQAPRRDGVSSATT